MGLKILIDTNILIHIEDQKLLSPALQEILTLIRDNGHRLSVPNVGIVESTVVLSDTESIVRAVGKRTIYCYDEIVKIAQKPALVILFRHHFNLPKPLSLTALQGFGVLKAAPQSIMELNDAGYKKVKEEADIDERFAFD